ncbi:hypothetical protein EX30DRAFT_399125 [Ascodesmis nigricans]|uniref:Uncharacterized protein n=1 Tax=Ascodesmis nigricans TaxID=341454 RepID=A0A4S2MIA1_9PEZI|nr:hypothetical protein EX30DRAFT_399125 [Ascodesmis nigricans]
MAMDPGASGLPFPQDPDILYIRKQIIDNMNFLYNVVAPSRASIVLTSLADRPEAPIVTLLYTHIKSSTHSLEGATVEHTVIGVIGATDPTTHSRSRSNSPSKHERYQQAMSATSWRRPDEAPLPSTPTPQPITGWDLPTIKSLLQQALYQMRSEILHKLHKIQQETEARAQQLQYEQQQARSREEHARMQRQVQETLYRISQIELPDEDDDEEGEKYNHAGMKQTFSPTTGEQAEMSPTRHPLTDRAGFVTEEMLAQPVARYPPRLMQPSDMEMMVDDGGSSEGDPFFFDRDEFRLRPPMAGRPVQLDLKSRWAQWAREHGQGGGPMDQNGASRREESRGEASRARNNEEVRQGADAPGSENTGDAQFQNTRGHGDGSDSGESEMEDIKIHEDTPSNRSSSTPSESSDADELRPEDAVDEVAAQALDNENEEDATNSHSDKENTPSSSSSIIVRNPPPHPLAHIFSPKTLHTRNMDSFFGTSNTAFSSPDKSPTKSTFSDNPEEQRYGQASPAKSTTPRPPPARKLNFSPHYPVEPESGSEDEGDDDEDGGDNAATPRPREMAAPCVPSNRIATRKCDTSTAAGAATSMGFSNIGRGIAMTGIGAATVINPTNPTSQGTNFLSVPHQQIDSPHPLPPHHRSSPSSPDNDPDFPLLRQQQVYSPYAEPYTDYHPVPLTPTRRSRNLMLRREMMGLDSPRSQSRARGGEREREGMMGNWRERSAETVGQLVAGMGHGRGRGMEMEMGGQRVEGAQAIARRLLSAQELQRQYLMRQEAARKGTLGKRSRMD